MIFSCILAGLTSAQFTLMFASDLWDDNDDNDDNKYDDNDDDSDDDNDDDDSNDDYYSDNHDSYDDDNCRPVVSLPVSPPHHSPSSLLSLARLQVLLSF